MGCVGKGASSSGRIDEGDTDLLGGCYFWRMSLTVSLPVPEVITLSSERGVPLESEESNRKADFTLPCNTRLANDLARFFLGVPFGGCRCCWMVRHS